MQREIEALLRAWQLGRQEEERAMAEIFSALAEFAAVRQKLLDDLSTALAPRPAPRHMSAEMTISEVIKKMRADEAHAAGGYN